MIKEEWGVNVSDEDRNQYVLGVCELCKFYPCECTREFYRFAENHFKDSEQDEQVVDLNEEIIPKKQNARNCQTIKPVSVKLAEDFGQDGSILCAPISVSIAGEKEETISRVGKRYMLDVPLSYDREKMKNGCIMNRHHVIQVECAEKTVAEGIGEDYRIELDYDGTIETDTENRWEPQQPIFISAQTGQGKNYFAEHILIPYVRELNYRNKTNHKVLILSNRLALRQQIKGHLGGNSDLEGEDEKVYYYNAFADVMTYQSILCNERRLLRKQKNHHARYIFVICDEAHFFTTDALFNPYTHTVLKKIVKIFQDAIRIYMSATPYECLEYIIKCEEEYQRNYLNWNKPQRKWKGKKMVFYHFKRDYSYLDVKTYSSIDELYGEIIDSVNRRKEKWLIFIDDKEKCKTVKENLELFAKDEGCPLTIEDDEAKKKSEKVFAVDADSKKDPIYQEILNAEKLNKDTYILISTSVLDNGINLTGIKNIVVSDMIKEKCLQMVGRARVSEDNAHKSLYIKRFSADEVDKRIKNLMRQQDAYHKYDMAYDELGNAFSRDYGFFDKYYGGNEMDWREAKHWFGKPISSESATKLYLNEIARSLMERLIPQYQCVLDEMIAEGSKRDNTQDSKCVSHIGQKYLEYQLSWFGKRYCVDDDITVVGTEKAREEFLAFLESYAGSGEEIEGQERMESFQAAFTKLHDAVFPRADRNLDRFYKYKKMNDILKARSIEYKIDGSPQKGPWTVVNFNWLLN